MRLRGTVAPLLALAVLTGSGAEPDVRIFRGDARHAYRDPAVVWDAGTFHLFFTLVETEADGSVFSYTAQSESTDLSDWTPPCKLTPRDGSKDYSSPGNVVKDGDEWVLCLQTYPRPGNRDDGTVRYGNDAARLFTMRSRDLRNWSAPELLRVKGPDVPEAEMGRMIDPYLLRDREGTWWCFYKQNGASISKSKDLRTWTPAGRTEAGENVCVLDAGDRYVMFHSPANGIGMKTSTDLVHWTDESGLITLGQKDWPWARGRLTAGAVIDARRIPGVGRYLMFFHGSGPRTEREGDFDRNASIGFVASDDLRDWRPYVRPHVLPETIVCTQTQLYPWREQARGYLGRYPNQPLLVDPDLPEDPNRDGIDEFPGWGSFHSQADYDITMREAKAMGVDGLALFAGRPARFFRAGADCPVKDMLSLPIVCLWEKDVTNSFREIEVALNNPRAYAYKGRFLLPSYWTAKYNTPEELKAKYDAIRAKYGDRFIFIAAVPTLSAQVVSYDRGGRVFTAAMTNHVETACRAYARVADGIQICEAHMQAKVERGERVFSETYWDTVHSIVRRVLDEPEFRGRKLLCSAAVNGHMNAYRGTYNTSEDCTRTLRASFETAIRYGADYIMLPEWDELNENTCYEPSLYGSRSVTRIVRHYMDLIRRRPHEALAGDDVAKPNLIVTYRKSLSPGEPLTVEVLNVPDGSREGALSVAVELTDENGTLLRAFGPRTIDEAKLQEERFPADTAELAPHARAVRVRLVWKKGTEPGGTVFEGLHPVDLAPGNDWNHLCAKQAIRDLAEPTKAEIDWTDGRVRADISCDEPIRYAMLCGNGCIQAIRGREGSDADRFREDGDHAVFQLTAYTGGRDRRVRREEPPFSYAVKGIPGAEWYFIKEVSKGERFEFRTLRGNGYAPSVYLRVPKSARIPLRTAFERTSYGVGVDADLQFVATRFGLQARYPSVANAKKVSFDLAADRDRASMVYHVQFTTMSGRVWFSRPFVREDGGAGRARTRVWSGLRNAVVDVDLPAARVPVLAYDFAPDAGTVVAPKSGERHWYGVLGGPHSMSTLWNRGCRTEGAIPSMTGGASDPDGSVPCRVREADGGWSLAFDGVGDYLSLPCGVSPAFSGFTVSFDVRPEKSVHPKKVASLYCSYGNLRNIGLREDGELVLVFAEMSDTRTVGTRCRLEFGAWSSIRVTNTGDRLKLSVNGKAVGEYPIGLPGYSASGTSVGGFPNWHDLCFFKGRLRNLVIDHRVSGSDIP